jgi:hypothetical protein
VTVFFKLLSDRDRAGMGADDIRAWNAALKFISESSEPFKAKVTVDGALIIALEQFMRRSLDGKNPPAPPPLPVPVLSAALPPPPPPPPPASVNPTNEFIL